MNKATKDQLVWLLKRVGGWVLFMFVMGLLASWIFGTHYCHPGEHEDSTLAMILVSLALIPGWGLPIFLATMHGGHSPNVPLGFIGLLIHFLLWLLVWEWKAVVTWIKKKP